MPSLRHTLVTSAALLLSAPAAAAAQDEDSSREGVDFEFRPGDGLVAESRDGQFGLSIRTRAQVQAAFWYPEAPEAFGGDLTAGGEDGDITFMIRRARVVFRGHVFGEHNRFTLQLALAPRDMDWDPQSGPTFTPLRDFYADFTHLRDLSVRVGQYKLPFTRERVNSSGELQFPDRSLVNAELTLDRDLAIDLRSRDFLGMGWLRYYVGVASGEGRDSGFGADLGLFYFGRVEVLPLGMFEDYEQADLDRNTQPRLSMGLSYAYLDEAPRMLAARGALPQDGGTTDANTVAADVLFKWLGFSFFAEMIWREGWRNPGGATDEMGNPLPITPPRNGIGVLLQTGLLIPGTDLEIAARLGLVHPIGGAGTSMRERGELGGGLTYYFGRHSYKLQLDYFHLWENGAFEDGTEQIRLQVQVAL